MFLKVKITDGIETFQEIEEYVKYKERWLFFSSDETYWSLFVDGEMMYLGDRD